ncbi:hypothetical protein J7M22_08390 [Candidatus Poribacteria bacterium]|nr:hypothetical protein [Candidatus Poribacteria bacterium]
MSIFDLSRQIIRDYVRYVQSFLSINDERVRQFVEDELIRRNTLWPFSLFGGSIGIYIPASVLRWNGEYEN